MKLVIGERVCGGEHLGYASEHTNYFTPILNNPFKKPLSSHAMLPLPSLLSLTLSSPYLPLFLLYSKCRGVLLSLISWILQIYVFFSLAQGLPYVYVFYS